MSFLGELTSSQHEQSLGFEAVKKSYNQSHTSLYSIQTLFGVERFDFTEVLLS